MTTYKLNEEQAERYEYKTEISEMIRYGILEEVKEPEWKPAKNDTVFTVSLWDGVKVESIVWQGDIYDLKAFQRGLIFKTSIEAEEAAEKIRNVLKEAKHS